MEDYLQKLPLVERLKSSENRDQEDPYINVLSLVTHIDSLEPEDLFQYVVTATLLTTYLERRTTFFESVNTSENDRYS